MRMAAGWHRGGMTSLLDGVDRTRSGVESLSRLQIFSLGEHSAFLFKTPPEVVTILLSSGLNSLLSEKPSQCD